MQISTDTSILESIFARSTAVAHFAGYVVDALITAIHEISRTAVGLLGKPYVPRRVEASPKDCEPEFNVANAIDDLCQLMAKADALASAAEDLLCRVVFIEDGDDRRRVERVAHLVGLTATAAHAAAEAGDKLAVRAVGRSTRRRGV